MAQADERAVPRRPAPASLRPFLHFTRFPPPALAAARRALDDDAFRARVLEVVDRDAVGEVAMLVLDRPAGWESALAERVARAASASAADAEVREVQRLTRQVDRTTERLSAVEARAVDLAAERDDARATRDALRDEVASLRRALDEVRGERSRAVRELKAAEGRAQRRAQDLAAARAELRDLQARLGDGDAGPEAAPAPAPPDHDAAAIATRGPAAAPTPAPAAPPDVGSSSSGLAGRGRGDDADEPDADEPDADGPAVDLAEVASAVTGASRAAAALAEALGRAATALQRSLGGAAADGAAADGATADGAAADGPDRPHDPARRPAAPDDGPPPGVDAVPGAPVRPRRRHRRPTRLPGGVLDDTPEALLALARTPEMLLVVDGYNVAKTAWPDLPIDAERARLVDGLSDLEARTGVEVVVVFDGAEQPGPTLAPPTPRRVRVAFSPPDVEADDVIVALVAELPDQRPVTVVSSDRRVQRGAADGGANVARADQLVALLRR